MQQLIFDKKEMNEVGLANNAIAANDIDDLAILIFEL